MGRDSGSFAAMNMNAREGQLCTHCQHVLSQDELRQILTVPNRFCHVCQPVLVHLEDGELLQLTWPG